MMDYRFYLGNKVQKKAEICCIVCGCSVLLKQLKNLTEALKFPDTG